MQVARYWRLKQHLYQLAIEAVKAEESDADILANETSNAADQKKPEAAAAAASATTREERIAVVA